MLLVPAGALTRITTAPEVVVGAAAEEYELVDLRRDALLHCHDNHGHSCLGETIAAVRSLAYWPDLVKPPGSKASAAAHMEACAHCIAKQGVLEEHGIGIDTVRRMKVLQLDHLVLTDEEKELAGCVGSLQIIDVATRIECFVLRIVNQQRRQHGC